MTVDEAPGQVRRGELRIYLGAAPGVGKTYATLGEAQRRLERGIDVVIGLVETHGRAKTAALFLSLALHVVERRLGSEVARAAARPAETVVSSAREKRSSAGYSQR